MYKGIINSVEYIFVKSNSISIIIEESIDLIFFFVVVLVLYKMLKVKNK